MTPRLRLLAFAVVFLAFLGALLAWLHRPAGGAAAASPAGGACRVPGYPHEILCGEISVPLAHGKSLAATRTLRWYRVPARARNASPDPLVWIAGGPGVDMRDRAAMMITTLRRIGNRRDLIWLEPRGMPAGDGPACVPAGPAPMAMRLEPLADASRAEACRAEWEFWGGAAALSAEARAADLVLLRRALGLRQVNVLAEGAGARVALAWLRQEPQALRSLVWDSPPPLTGPTLAIRGASAAQALRGAFTACAQDARCQRAYPDPAGDFSRTRQRLPAQVVLPHPQSGAVEALHFTDAMLANMLDGLLRSPARASALPAALQASARGDWQPLFGLAALGWARQDAVFGWSLWLAEACLDGSRLSAPPADPLAAWFFAAQAELLNGACSGMTPMTPPAREEVALSVPTLVLASGVDPLGDAPPRAAQAVEVPGAGHGALMHGCAQDVVFRFVNAGGRLAREALDAACLERVAYPAPFVPAGPAGALP